MCGPRTYLVVATLVLPHFYGSPPWWIGQIYAVSVENGTVTSFSVHECGDEKYRNVSSASATHARIFRKVTQAAQVSESGEVILPEVVIDQYLRSAHGRTESGYKPVLTV